MRHFAVQKETSKVSLDDKKEAPDDRIFVESYGNWVAGLQRILQTKNAKIKAFSCSRKVIGMWPQCVVSMFVN